MPGEIGEIVQTFFEDVEPGVEGMSREMTLERDDIIAFASAWDPLPIHLSDEAAKAAGFGGLTASGTHLLAVKHRLVYDFGFEQSAVASFGFDEVRFRAPGRPGDRVRVRLRWESKRLSESRPGQGVVRYYCELVRDDGVVLISLYDNLLMRCRP